MKNLLRVLSIALLMSNSLIPMQLFGKGHGKKKSPKTSQVDQGSSTHSDEVRDFAHEEKEAVNPEETSSSEFPFAHMAEDSSDEKTSSSSSSQLEEEEVQTENPGVQHGPENNVPNVPTIIINMQMPAEDSQEDKEKALNDGRCGPTKEKTVEKAELLSDPLLKICYDGASEEIKDVVLALQNRDRAKKTNNIPTAILLYGPHGTGKTTLAQVFAQMSVPAMDCWVIHAGTLLNSYKNGAEEALRASLDSIEQIKQAEKALKANLEPIDHIDNDKQCVVLIDEVDSLTDGTDNEKDGNRAVATTMAFILDKLSKKQNMLLVLATNKLDKIPEIVTDRLKLRYFKVDLPQEEGRKTAIKYWFDTFGKEENEFKCEYVQYFHKFRKTRTQEEKVNDFKQYLLEKTNKLSYRNITDLFERAAWTGLKRALKEKKPTTTITAEDFTEAFVYIEAKKKELEKDLWDNTKEFCKDNPGQAGFIGAVVVAAGSFIAYRLWIHNPAMKLNEEQHKATLAAQKAQHEDNKTFQKNQQKESQEFQQGLHDDAKKETERHHQETKKQTEFSQSTQIAALGLTGTVTGAGAGVYIGAAVGSAGGPIGAVGGAIIGGVVGGAAGVGAPYAVHKCRK